MISRFSLAFRSFIAGPCGNVERLNPLVRNKNAKTLRVTLKFYGSNGIQQRLNHTFQVFSGQTRQPFTVKLDSPEFRTIITPELKKLVNIFMKHDHEIRIVGGAVRDLLMYKIPDDLDFASTATPEQMTTMFEQENVRMFNLKGKTHGTVTVRIDDKMNFSITSLRIILLTGDGKTKLEFTTDWYLDARCRDLTINAMFLDVDGTVFDYFNGIDALEKKEILFVGNSADRIREDYIRILRYFRFHSLISKDSNSYDPEILQAIKENLHGLSGISNEKIWAELKKCLSGKFQLNTMKTMLEVGLASYIGLPDNLNINEFEMLCEKAADFSLHPVTIIASLLQNESQMMAFTEKMLISHFEENVGHFIIKQREMKPEVSLKYCQERLILAVDYPKEVRQWIEQYLSYIGNEDVLKEFQNWEVPKFPVSGKKLFELGLPPGKKCDFILRAMRKLWFDSSFTLTEEDLLSRYNDIKIEVSENFDTLKQTETIRKKRKKKKSFN